MVKLRTVGKSLSGRASELVPKRRWHGCCYDSTVLVSATEI